MSHRGGQCYLAYSMLAYMQVFLTACSHILRYSLPGSEAAGGTAPLSQAKGTVEYATRIALTAVLRLSKAATPETFTAVFRLDKFIATVSLLRKTAFGGTQLLLEVLVATLQGAGQAEIEGVLPQLMSFTVGSSDTVQVCPSPLPGHRATWLPP